jgi:transcriptional regulator with XRE-family HTH domain
MTEDAPKNANSRRLIKLAKAFHDRGFRHGFINRQLKAFLAQQIRALRGDMRQEDFGKLIGKPQSVVSRLEKQADRQISIQTLIDIAEQLDIAVIIRFVDFPTFLKYTQDYTDEATAPAAFDQAAVDRLAVMESNKAETMEALGNFVQRQAEAQKSLGSHHTVVDLESGGLQQPAPLPRDTAPIPSAQIIPLRPLQQRIDERNFTNVGQPQRRAS